MALLQLLSAASQTCAHIRSTDEALAQIGDETLTVREFRLWAEAHVASAHKSRDATSVKRLDYRALVEDWINDRLLAEEARRLGLAEAPEIAVAAAQHAAARRRRLLTAERGENAILDLRAKAKIEIDEAVLSTIEPVPAALPDAVVARVDGASIAASDVTRALVRLVESGRFYHAYGSPDVKTKARRAALTDVIDERLVTAAVAREGLHDPDLEISTRVAVDRALVRAFRRVALASHVRVTREEADAYLRAHPDEFRPPERRLLYVIVALHEGDLLRARSELDAGADFAGVARAYSIDRGSRERGGLLGYSTDQQLPPVVAAAANSLPVGAVSSPIAAGRVYYLVRVAAVEPGPVPPAEMLLRSVRNRMTQERIDRAEAEYLLKLRERATIVIHASAAAGLQAGGTSPREP